MGIHQGSALSPLLFIMIEAAAKEGRDEGTLEVPVCRVLDVDSRNSRGGDMVNLWKAGMEQRRMNTNMENMKLMVSGKTANRKVESGRWP